MREITMKISMRAFIRSFIKDRSGVTGIEYGLIASLVAITIVGAVSNIGQTELKTTFVKVNAGLTG
jgi:pilus assembly protein Flp/PilA